MTERKDFAQQCDGKRRYRSRAKAKHRARAEQQRGDLWQIAEYSCPWCRFWHIGHLPRREAERRVAWRLESPTVAP